MNFNVALSSDIGYNRPVEQASSTGGAIASFLSSAIRNIPEKTQPSNDERFAKAMKGYQDKMPELRSTDDSMRNKAYTKLTPQFLSDYPEFASEYNSLTSAMGIKLEVPFVDRQEDAKEAALVDFTTKDPEGIVADRSAKLVATKDGVFDENTYKAYLEEALLKQSSRKNAISQLESQNLVDTDILKKSETFGRDMTTTYLGGYIDLLNQVRSGQTVQLPEGTFSGFTEVNLKNVEAFAQVARSQVANEIVSTFSKEYAEKGMTFPTPTTEWLNSVLGPLDVAFTTTASEDAGSISSIRAVEEYNSVDNARKALETANPELAAALELSKAFGPSGNILFQELVTKGLVEIEVASTLSLLISSNATGEQLTTYVESLSKTDAAQQSEATALTLNSGSVTGKELANSVTHLFETNKRGNNNAVMGVDTFNNTLVKNAQGIIEQAAADPVFGSKVTDNLSADIKKTLDSANEDIAGFGFKVEVSNGFLVLAKRQPDGTWAKIKEGIQKGLTSAAFGGADYGPKDTPSMKALLNKWESLEKFGTIGEEIKGAFEMTQAPEAGSENSYKIPEEVKKDTAFMSKVQSVSNDLEINPNDLLRVIEFETAGSWSPAVKNPNSTAIGLIQFLESTAKDLGTTTDALSKMSAAEQMDYVAGYLRPYKGRIKNFGDIYMAVHWPAGIGKDESYVMYKEGSNEYNVNKSLDTNGDGTVTRGETIASVISRTGGGKATTPFTGEAQQLLDDAKSGVESVMPPAPQTTSSMAPQAAPTASPEVTEEQPSETPTEQPRATSEAPVVSAEGQALLASIGGEADKTFTSQEEFQAATAAGELEAGDIVSVNGELYFIRRDGSAQKVG